jgi:hypothetical protein
LPGHTSCTPLRRKMLRFTERPLATASQSEFSLQHAQRPRPLWELFNARLLGIFTIFGDSTDSSRSTLKKAQQFWKKPTCWSAHQPERVSTRSTLLVENVQNWGSTPNQNGHWMMGQPRVFNVLGVLG